MGRGVLGGALLDLRLPPLLLFATRPFPSFSILILWVCSVYAMSNSIEGSGPTNQRVSKEDFEHEAGVAPNVLT